MNNFKIHDNFFPPEEIQTINEYITRPKWSFNGGGTYLEDDSFKSHFWHMDGLEKEEYFGKTFNQLTIETVKVFLQDSKKSMFKI